MNRHTRMSRGRIVTLSALVLLLVAMLLNTRFLTARELANALPKPFDATAVAADLYRKAQAQLPARATPGAEVIPAIQRDPKAAADEFKAAVPAEGAYVFPIRVTGTVTAASSDLLRLKAEGVSGDTVVVVPLTTAVNGAVLRDAMGFKFADAPGQSDYQFVGDELKKLIIARVGQQAGDAASLKGKRVEVVGVTNVVDTGGPPSTAKPVSVQPLTLTVTS